MKTRALQIAALLACIALVVGAGYVKFFGLPHHTSSLTELTEKNINLTLQSATTPMYIVICSDKITGCDKQEQVAEQLASHYKGKVEFARIDAGTQTKLAASILGAGHLNDLPAHLVVNGGGVLAGYQGTMSDAELTKFLDFALEAGAGEALVAHVDTKGLGEAIKNAATGATVIELCSSSDGSCASEEAAVGYNALQFKDKVHFVVFDIDSAKTPEEQQAVMQLAKTLGIQQVPTFIAVNGSYAAVAGGLGVDELRKFTLQMLNAPPVPAAPAPANPAAPTNPAAPRPTSPTAAPTKP